MGMEQLLSLLEDEIKNKLTPIIYFESFSNTDIVKKIYRKDQLSTEIIIEFWNGYICELDSKEFTGLVDNITVPFIAYMQDIGEVGIEDKIDVGGESNTYSRN